MYAPFNSLVNLFGFVTGLTLASGALRISFDVVLSMPIRMSLVSW